MMGIGLLLWIAVLGGVAALVVWAVRRPGGVSGAFSGHRSGDDAMGILERRYACGELTREQFLQMKQDLDARQH